MERGKAASVAEFCRRARGAPGADAPPRRGVPRVRVARDAHGWVASNQEFTHTSLGVRADRVVCHGDAPRGFLIHGQGPVLWTTYLNDGPPRPRPRLRRRRPRARQTSRPRHDRLDRPARPAARAHGRGCSTTPSSSAAANSPASAASRRATTSSNSAASRPTRIADRASA